MTHSDQQPTVGPSTPPPGDRYASTAGKGAQIFAGSISDGKTAASYPARVTVRDDGLEVWRSDLGHSEFWAYDTIWMNNPIRKHHDDVLLHAPEAPGATLFVEDRAFPYLLLERSPHLGRRAHLWRFVRPALYVWSVIALIVATIEIFDLSPARAVAQLLPESLLQTAGNNVYAGIKKQFHLQECTAGPGLAAVEIMVRKLSHDQGASSDLDVRVLDWSLANAFALPGGRIILTKGLLREAKSPDEVAGVLAHEMGHGIHRHPETSMVRGFGLQLAGQTLFPGADTLGGAAVLLTQLSFSREAEREADAEALKLLRGAGISAKPLGEFFARLNKEEEGSAIAQALRKATFLSTHPATGERAAAIREIAEYPSTPSLSNSEWSELRSICGAEPVEGTGAKKGITNNSNPF